jgi:hypothetical protein
MMSAAEATARYLVEWYRPSLEPQVIDTVVARLDLATAGMCAEGTPVRLLMTLAVPSDEVLYAVFAANSPELVQTACARAGAQPDRMSLDVDARITQ